ncbi:RNA polymerase sigma factor [Amycolatopsis sp. CA-230715]|uniref:RNA polymerase sigma factor n=1 Tax=Amycolatopsis sp. CA-230715 TaxID=2745196 RepID=UPI001C00D14D|nr:DUF6596 domain-containing protein [Amycolatopsis sp. CA-230715]QWF82899.1 hypothetical protein HUW46_06338 [Amycolatopsis sp. CA-230715]
MRDQLSETFRAEHGRVLARLVTLLGDLDVAEEALADAYATAMQRWPVEGVPANPAAWLITVARNRGVDRIRRETALARKLTLTRRDTSSCRQVVADGGDGDPFDDQLRLFFTCCHPALSVAVQVALTLRCLAGLSTPEIARLLLVSDTTVAQRIVRAKRKIRDAAIPFRVLRPSELPERLPPVLTVLYLLFTEGYVATSGPRHTRDDLSAEAIRLTRQLHRLLPDDAEATGLLALQLLTEARRPARLDEQGRLVVLEDQDRTRWDRELIHEGQQLLTAALAGAPAGPFAVQGAIAALHAGAPTARHTDWRQIAALYRVLGRLAPSPMVQLNHAIAVAMADGPDTGLRLLDRLRSVDALARTHLLPAARADLLRRLGRVEDAITAYDQALERVGNDIERDYLTRRRRQLLTDGAPTP